jgi:Holliday junction resolvase RusA-like endonuclease
VSVRPLPRVAGRPATAAQILIPGRVPGKKRHKTDTRGARPRTYHDDAAVLDEQAIQLAWMGAGRPDLGPGPIVFDLITYEQRPKDHWLTDGASLSAEGRRTPFPLRKPDGDNVWKLVADALQTRAFGDDARIVDGRVRKRWCPTQAHPEHAVLSLHQASEEDLA